MLVDGIRGDAEVDFFRAHFPRFILVGVDAPFPVRLARLNSRGRDDDMLDAGDLTARDAREVSWGLGRALALADHLVGNGGTMEEFERETRRLLEEIREDPCA
ncbi:putative dephospho-coa kinase archaeal [hydrocarbon metagenome]|uniref:Putative dephospho-coa kinase archaeal n=1 Tax=hydrocarbon metagenome TaxID=938273 RepID=A0A0W8F3A0_9ZZZZ